MKIVQWIGFVSLSQCGWPYCILQLQILTLLLCGILKLSIWTKAWITCHFVYHIFFSLYFLLSYILFYYLFWKFLYLLWNFIHFKNKKELINRTKNFIFLSKIVFLKGHFFSFLFFLRLYSIWIILLSHTRRLDSLSSRFSAHRLKIIWDRTFSSTWWFRCIMSPWALHNLRRFHVQLSGFPHIFTLWCKIVKINSRTFSTIFNWPFNSIIFSVLYFLRANFASLCSFDFN